MADNEKIKADNQAEITKAVIATATEAAVKDRSLAEAGANALTIPWPQDPQGALKDLKRGGIAAAARIKGDKDKLNRYLKALKLLAQHAKALHDRDSDSRKTARDNAAAAEQRIAERLARQAEARAKQHEAAAERVRREAGIRPVNAA